MQKKKYLLFLGAWACLFVTGVGACRKPAPRTIVPGTVWHDTDGKPINAHGGGILYHDGTYYWYGEYKGDSTRYSPDICVGWRAEAGGVACYSSADLAEWTFEGVVLPPDTANSSSDLHPSQIIERPKVVYNDKTEKFVMWVHIDDPNYEKAHAGVAVADSPTGPFTYLGSCKPNGEDSRDQTLFKDDDGRAYHIYSSEWNKTLHIGLLNEDYTRHTGTYTRNFVGQYREAPAVFKHEGKYYLISSGCTGWDPNTAQCAVADSMLGEWTVIGNPCKGEGAETTFGAQSTFVLPVEGQEGRLVAMFDRWNKTDLDGSRYVWLPIAFTDGRPVIEWKDAWNLDE